MGADRELAEPPLRILLLEDSDIDAELAETHLQAGSFRFSIERAIDRESFESRLASTADVILADYSLPDFDGLAALAMARDKQPGVPFIFVSGVVGEEFATNALQQGAVDYVTKRNLRRLPSAVGRAVAEAQERLRRQKTEADLRASEAGSRIALRAAGLGGWDHDLVADSMVWDARCRSIFGVTPAQAVDNSFFLSLLHEEDRERVRRAIERATAPGGPNEFSEQFRATTPTGAQIWVESIGSAIVENGACQRFVGIVRDITREKQAELALLDRTASLEASIEQQAMERHLLWRNSQDLLAILGPDGRLRDATPSFERILGLPVPSILGRLLMDIVHPEDRGKTEAALKAARPQQSTQFENRLAGPSGAYRWFSWTMSPDESGVFYANGRDTTEEKAAAERVRVVEEALRQSQKMEAIGQLTGGIAHDFNNLLAGIIGSIDVIRRRVARKRYDDLDRFMDAAVGSAQKAAALTQRLLAFSRRQSLDVRPEDVATVIASMEELLRGTLGENITLDIDCETGLWRANTDSNQLESAILNLAINARDAMPEGGRLGITTRNFPYRPEDPPIDGLEPGDWVRIVVSDNGEGMSEDTAAKAFDPFFTTKPIGQGTGLGLSMVYGFVKQSGGHVNIVSRRGKGTSVELYLSRGLPSEQIQVAAAPVLERPSEGETILVIEDDDAVRMLIVELLGDLGYKNLEARDAASALPLIESDARIDMIVSDVGLPGLSGRKLAELARQRRSAVPILFVTGYAAGAEHREGYLGAGMQMLAKPFRNEDLIARIDEMLGRGRHRFSRRAKHWETSSRSLSA